MASRLSLTAVAVGLATLLAGCQDQPTALLEPSFARGGNGPASEWLEIPAADPLDLLTEYNVLAEPHQVSRKQKGPNVTWEADGVYVTLAFSETDRDQMLNDSGDPRWDEECRAVGRLIFGDAEQGITGLQELTQPLSGSVRYWSGDYGTLGHLRLWFDDPNEDDERVRSQLFFTADADPVTPIYTGHLTVVGGDWFIIEGSDIIWGKQVHPKQSFSESLHCGLPLADFVVTVSQ
jgi:hypothetical protein